MKRIFDLFVSIALLIFLFPLIFILAILIRIKLGSPILFKQERPGLFGKPFYLYKFRSMTNEKDINGQLKPDEVRLTSFGMFIRNYSLDEIPQLLNVIKGELSLVGPRPLLMEYLPLYTKEQLKRHHAKPGITGWAQVNGRNDISWEKKFELDNWYVKNQSFWLDLRILVLTVFKVIKKENISQTGHVTTSNFTGISGIREEEK